MEKEAKLFGSCQWKELQNPALPQVYFSGTEKLCCVWFCMIYPDKGGSFYTSSVMQSRIVSLHALSRYWRNVIHAECANEGSKEELSSAVECCLACWLLCMRTHTHSHSFMYTQRDTGGGEKGKFFTLTLSLTKGLSEISEWAVKIWRRIQLQLVFHVCVECSGFQFKSAS